MDLSRIALPIVPHLPRISELLDHHRVLVLSAEPGAGKSTIVPPYLMGAAWLGGRSIVMLEPRRLAAASVAARIAELLGEPVGRRAGYRVRAASHVSSETRIEVVTEALLTRRIQHDPLLQGVGLVIFDEFHERSIHADLALALALEVRRARSDLAVLVMSATLESERLSSMLGNAPTLACPGTLYQVQTRYQPPAQAARWEESLADGIQRLFDETEGDALVFLPGAGEIRRLGGRLAGRLSGRAEVLPLHGTMRLEDQRRVIAPVGGVSPAAGEAPAASATPTGGATLPGPRRIILATSIAETSLTVPGIRTVVDSGWARLSRFHAATGLDRLVTERVSAATADQRRGRAGRLGPGLCVRLWSESERLLPHPQPEILRSDLTGLVLECALWGARRPDGLSWLDPPPASSWDQSWEILVMLGLVDPAGVTSLGRTVADLGLAPRLGVLVVEGRKKSALALAAACAAILQERDGSGIPGDPDLRLRLELLRSGAGGSQSWHHAVRLEQQRILRRMGSREDGGAEPPESWSEEQEGNVGNLLASAFADRIARREPDRTYRLLTGRVVRFPGSGPGAGVRIPVASRAATPWIVTPDADAGETVGIIHLAAPVAGEEVDLILARVAEEAPEIRWEGLVPKGFLVRRAGRLVLSERPTRPSAADVAASFQALLQRQGLSILPWNASTRELLSRMRFLARCRPDRGLGDLSEQGLAARAEQWLGPYLELNRGQVLGSSKLQAALSGLLGSNRGELDREAPQSLTLPTGRRRAIDYSGAEPAVEARIQEVFGLARSPLVCGVPLTFRLLSPASRPLQITRDLASFWATTYAEVRKEMRGRYPKHYWPEDPLQAEPISGVRPKT